MEHNKNILVITFKTDKNCGNYKVLCLILGCQFSEPVDCKTRYGILLLMDVATEPHKSSTLVAINQNYGPRLNIKLVVG